MKNGSFALLAAAALALGASPALAQHMGHGHGSMGGHGMSGGQGGAAAFAEGKLEKGVRVFDVSVTDDGFVPSRLIVNTGEKVRLVVTRKTDATCAKEIVIKDHGVERPLPLDQAVTVEFTPKKAGEIRFACGMDHVSGIAFVR